jgi:hypothetical protein
MAKALKTRPAPPEPVTLTIVDLGDTALVIQVHDDGLFTLDMPAAMPLVLTEEQLQLVVGAFAKLGKDRGWL